MRFRDKVMISLCLSVPVGAAGAMAVDYVTAETGTEVVTVRMSLCMNPGLDADGSHWDAADHLPAAVWDDGEDLVARFTWRGNTGVLHTDDGDVAYSRVVGRFGSMDCALG